jgi:hypothetical protein
VDYYAGLDVSLEQTSVCVVDAQGQVVRESKVASEPDALICFLRGEELEIARVGLEAGPLSQWLHWTDRRRFRGGAAGDPSCEGGVVGNDGEDRPA